MNCPFCGSDNVVGTYTNVYMGTEEVLCKDCDQYFEVDISRRCDGCNQFVRQCDLLADGDESICINCWERRCTEIERREAESAIVAAQVQAPDRRAAATVDGVPVREVEVMR